MIETLACSWCEAWDQEVGIIYDKTEEGRIAPPRRVDIDDPRPADLEPVNGIVHTPTFMLLDAGTEVGRILGYPGDDHFWGLLGELLGRLAPAPGT